MRADARGVVHRVGQGVTDVARKAKDTVIGRVDLTAQKPGKSQEMLAAHIAQQREVIVISRLVPDALRIQHSSELVLAMYRKHIGVQNDEKGVYYCAFGNAGYLAGIDVSLDLVKMVLPPFSLPLGVNVELKASLQFSAGGVKQLLLMLHRSFPKQVSLQTINPLCFMALSGWEKRATAGISVQAGASVEPPTLINLDGYSLSINLVNLQAGLKAGCRYIRLTDSNAGWYPSCTDANLETDVAQFANPDKEVLKGLLNEWRRHLRDEVFQTWKTSRDSRIKPFMEHLNQRLTFDISLSQGVVRSSSEQVENWLNGLGWHLRDLYKNGYTTTLTPQEYNQGTAYISTARTMLAQAKARAETARQTGQKLPQKQGNAPIGHVPRSTPRCRADIAVWSLGANAAASTGVDVSQAVSLGQFIQATEIADVASVQAGLQAGARTELTGRAQFMSSRYQTESPPLSRPGQNVVLTQDTKVTYTQAIWTYQAGGGITLPFDVNISYQKAGQRFLKNDMSYSSATAYWEPASLWTVNDRKSARLETGSGLSLGISMSLKKIQVLKASQNQTPANIRHYPFHLGLTISQFIAFINAIPSSLFDPTFMQENPYILIESSFRFQTQQFVEVKADGELESLCNKFFQSGRIKDTTKLALETVRCRVRLGSDLDQTKTSFKLGVDVLGVGGGVELTKIRQAENMFIKDLCILDFIVPRPVVSGVGLAGQQAGGAVAVPVALHPDQKVPAVVLLPHTFQLD